MNWKSICIALIFISSCVTLDARRSRVKCAHIHRNDWTVLYLFALYFVLIFKYDPGIIIQAEKKCVKYQCENQTYSDPNCKWKCVDEQCWKEHICMPEPLEPGEILPYRIKKSFRRCALNHYNEAISSKIMIK